jgi:hypothetical protein
MPSPVLQFRRGNAGVAGTVPALRPGEPAFSLNNFDLFVGFDTSVAGNKFFGSHRYWGREDGTTSLRLKLVDKTGISGTIQLKAPDTFSGITTYTLPNTYTPGYFLKVGADGTLSWDTVTSSGSFENSTLTGNTSISGSLNVSAGSSFSGITTFTNTTDNTLGDPNTGAVQIDGGLGVDRNVTIGAGLSVVGQSHFIGTATFYGGAINLGDSTGDNISFGGRINSNLVPSIDNQYDVGISTLNWRNAHFSGIGTFETGAVIDAVQIGITAAGEIDTTSGGLTLDSQSGQTTIDDDLIVTGNLFINGSTTQVNTTTLNVKDTLVDLGLIDTGGGVLGVPTIDVNKDIGILLNYYTGSSARKAAVFWDDSEQRIGIASSVTDNLSVLENITYAAIEISELYINNGCSGGSQPVIQCAGNVLQLQNITIDAGFF